MANSYMKTHTPKIRENWNEAFSDMAKNNDDKLLDVKTVSTSEWDKTEWEW